jgi:hypothetical protein
MHTIGVQSRKRALQLMQIIFAKRQLDSMTEEDRHALRRRKLRDRLMFVLTNKISARKTRRVVKRNEGGWKASTINQYIETGDETTYRLNFRVSKETFDMITTKLQNAGYVKTNAARNRAACQTAAFKIGVCMYFLAHGKGDAKVVGDAAGLGASTVRSYLKQFIAGSLAVLKPEYMPGRPPSPENVELIRQQFASRRGIGNVAMAVDGSHVPFVGGADYRNYKGWESILAVDADVGSPGCSGDNSVLKECKFMQAIKSDPEAWLGKDGVIAADGGASDHGELLLNPYFDAKDDDELWFNFCLSSTRFFVEETFGRWKNRFRFLLYDSTLSHKLTTQLIYVSMILHNLCTVHGRDHFDLGDSTDEDWKQFFESKARMTCPSCARKGAMHCPHAKANRVAKPADGETAKEKRDAIKDMLFQRVMTNVEEQGWLHEVLQGAQSE